MDISSIKEKILDLLLASVKRIVLTLFSLIILISIPITYSLVGQRLDIRQQAASPGGNSGPPSCQWNKASINPGETAELLLVNYDTAIPNAERIPAPVISPSEGYKTLGKSDSGNLLYELDTPGTVYTASLIDPNISANDTVKTVATCIISTTGASQSPPSSAGQVPQPNSGSYNILLSCLQASPACDSKARQSVDFNGDGTVDAKDLNVFLRTTSSKQ